MDGHVEESSSSREKPTESEERLRKKIKQPKERNYGVKIKNYFFVVFFFIHDSFLVNINRNGCNKSKLTASSSIDITASAPRT